jgi:hypothetical protein
LRVAARGCATRLDFARLPLNSGVGQQPDFYSRTVTDDSSISEEAAAALVVELKRIFGENLDSTPMSDFFVLLPLVTESEFIDFLRTVPAGTAVTALVELASQYRAGHPLHPLAD